MLVFKLRGYNIIFLAPGKRKAKDHKMPFSNISLLKKLESMANWISLVCFIWGLEKPCTIRAGLYALMCVMQPSI